MARSIVHVELKGDKELIAKFHALIRELPKQAAQFLIEEAETIVTEAKKLTPVDTGALRSTGHVQKPIIR